MCFVFIWEQTATCATYSMNWLVFITEMKSVYSAVRTGSLNKAACASYLKGWRQLFSDSFTYIYQDFYSCHNNTVPRFRKYLFPSSGKFFIHRTEIKPFSKMYDSTFFFWIYKRRIFISLRSHKEVSFDLRTDKVLWEPNTTSRLTSSRWAAAWQRRIRNP